MNWINKASNRYKKDQEATFERVGFYLVHSSGRYFISEKVSESALERVCDKVLTKDYNYWIDYSFGKDVQGNIAWSNLDHTDKFI